MMNESNLAKKLPAFPTLAYFNDALVVDKAWVDARSETMVVELEGLLYQIFLAVARRAGGRMLDEGDLHPVPASTTTQGLWPLDGDSVHARYWVILRDVAERLTFLHMPYYVFEE